MIQFLRTFLLVVGLVGATVSATPTSECVYTNNRLPKHIVPKHYDLDINIDTQKHEYSGEVTINIKVDRNGDEQVPNNIIVLNVHRDVQLFDVTYIDIGAGQPSGEDFSLSYNSVEGICRGDENEFLVIKLGDNLENQAEGQLIIPFRGIIREDNTGIYKSKYRSQSGLDSYHVSTDFKPNKARRAFPCFDEPSFKATFDIEITHDSAKIALANTALDSEEITSGRKLSIFKRTPLMSTYLLGFAIGEFDYIETKFPVRDLTIRAFTPVDKSEQARFALDTAVSAIEFLEEFFHLEFPLNKLDMLSGVQINYGAMENWGLIICNTSMFLFDHENTSPLYQGYIAETVIHGISNQWFGNLVTLNWWNDLWLNEGFAAWMSGYLTNRMYPELEWEQNRLFELHQTTLDLDSQQEINPIIQVAKPDENVYGSIDNLVYSKSHAIIKFLHGAYLGHEKFEEGIRKYMTDHMFGNADASDLWKVLQDVSGLPVTELVESWTLQAGHPLVDVRMSPDVPNRLIFEQKREYPKAEIEWTYRVKQKWIIPLTIRLGDGSGQQHLTGIIFDQLKHEIDLPSWFNFAGNPNFWLKINDNFSGFYRVLYDNSLLERLEKPCRTRQLSSSNRIGLLDDLRALHLRRRRLTAERFGNALTWYSDGTESSVMGQVARAYRLLPQSSKQVTKSFRLGNRLFAPYYNKLLTEQQQNVDPNVLAKVDSIGLASVFSTLVELNYEQLINDALTEFNRRGNKVAPIIREFVYKAVALRGSDEQRGVLESFLKLPDIGEEETKRINSALTLIPRRHELPKLPTIYSNRH